jgi:hypothetical protein
MSPKFSVLENLTRRALQEKPTRLDLEILMKDLGGHMLLIFSLSIVLSLKKIWIRKNKEDQLLTKLSYLGIV